MLNAVQGAVTTTCRGCAAEQESGALFCAHCGRIQPPQSGDFFTVFGLERRLEIDPAALEETFYRLTRRLHPDRFARAGEDEKQWSLAGTALVNDAYRTLQDPLRRTEYLLKLAGAQGEQSKERVPADLLEEVFELNMQLDAMRAAQKTGEQDRALQAGLAAAREKFAAMVETVDRELRAQWAAWDGGNEEARRTAERAMARLLDRRRFVSNLVRDVNGILGE